jgi:hypothetical protein
MKRRPQRMPGGRTNADRPQAWRDAFSLSIRMPSRAGSGRGEPSAISASVPRPVR